MGIEHFLFSSSFKKIRIHFDRFQSGLLTFIFARFTTIRLGHIGIFGQFRPRFKGEDVRDYNKEIHKQEKTEDQKESWVSTNQVKDIWEELKKDADLLYKKKTLKPADLQQIQSFIILSLLGGIFIPPRRSKDYVDFMIFDVDKSKDNYFDKGKMYFNSYKTAKTYGQQVVDVPKPLQSILKKWVSVNPTKSLLFDANMNHLSSVKLNQRLNKIFDEKKVSVNQLRHTYLTAKFGHTIGQKNTINNTMAEMGSSSNMLDTYVKKD